MRSANTVSVKVKSLYLVRYSAVRAKEAAATFGGLTLESRQKINVALDNIVRELYQFRTLFDSETIEFHVWKIRELRTLVVAASACVQSARRMTGAERKQLLGPLAGARKELDTYLQLNLFVA